MRRLFQRRPSVLILSGLVIILALGFVYFEFFVAPRRNTFNCLDEVPEDVFQVATQSPMGPNLTRLFPSPDGKYTAVSFSDHYGDSRLRIWMCNGTGLIFETDSYAGSMSPQGYRPLVWIKQGLLVEYHIPLHDPEPVGPNGLYLFVPETRKWLLLQKNGPEDFGKWDPASAEAFSLSLTPPAP